ncbi:hypothetical protein [Novosphingobium guangzhouense]|uniref:Uncharacterized protein n=1 Tax=Novosphingobium guangzhouense TaxID=1850347 RepID=A0A2K2FZB9_9SPHN|nr:hypothetical protein [Novosphingobium guangzhouense]PNU04130.1 hypothetical protein A8V01_05925 [Novosphingobium guangzhouense]
MRMPPRTYLVGAAVLALLAAGAAEAAGTQSHTMKVDAPDGTVVHVRYSGDVAPQVQFLPADAQQQVSQQADMPVMADPFAHMAQVSAMMDAQMNAMMQRAALMQAQVAQVHSQMQQHAVAADAGAASIPGLMMVGDVPKGARVSYYSSSTDANGCTRSVSYSSDGSGAQPKMTQAASDGCDAAKAPSQAIPAKAEAPAEQAPPPGRKV